MADQRSAVLGSLSASEIVSKFYVQRKPWKDIAAEIGVSTQVLHTYRQRDEFVAAEKRFRNQIIEELHNNLLAAGEQAVKTCEEICGDEDAPPMARISAARAILERLIALKIEESNPEAVSKYAVILAAVKKADLEDRGIRNPN